MAPVFLIGGGRGDDAVRASHAAFVRAVGDGPIAVVVLDEGAETDPPRWTRALALAGTRDSHVVVVSPARPPRAGDVAGAAGIFVAGGWTPGYQEALVTAGGTGWLPAGVPYAGFSAGAAVAASTAIVGGWRLDGVEVCAPEAGEDLDELAVRPGLGLVPFAVDVHAAQWGTPTRLLHAVRARLAPDGWAVDEGTVVVVGDGPPRVEGLGCAYRVSRADGGLGVTIVGGTSTATAAGRAAAAKR
jgi:cyanophycinase